MIAPSYALRAPVSAFELVIIVQLKSVFNRNLFRHFLGLRAWKSNGDFVSSQLLNCMLPLGIDAATAGYIPPSEVLC